jgi:hypothetical protein
MVRGLPVSCRLNGAVVFDAGTSGASVTFDGATFQTSSSKPIGYDATADWADDVIVDTGVDGDDSGLALSQR